MATTLGACEFISPVDANPNTVPEATVDQLFTGAQVISYFLGTGGLSRIASIWTQQMAGVDRQFATFDAYTITDADFEDEFNALYTQGGLIDIREGIRQAEDAGRTAYAGILKIHEAYLVGMHASFFGDIPYREAVSDVEDPALDDQAQVYADVQALLDEAITDLAGGGIGPGAVDKNFGGDVARWTAVARTLKGRFYMHTAEVGGNAAYTAARDAVLAGAGGITTAAGSWRARFNAANPERNMWTQFMIDRSGYVASGDYLLPLMVANADPRLGIYYSQAAGGGYTPRVSLLSATGYGEATYDIPMVTCAENYFILAEAHYRLANPVAAVTAAQAALTCEEATHGLAADALGGSTRFVGLTGAALLAEIMEQKYIASFLMTEAYNDYKRTCLPDITERVGGMPGRLFYAQQERLSNSNVPATGVDPNDKYNDNDPAPCP
jgi:hypothetical protein